MGKKTNLVVLRCFFSAGHSKSKCMEKFLKKEGDGILNKYPP